MIVVRKVHINKKFIRIQIVGDPDRVNIPLDGEHFVQQIGGTIKLSAIDAVKIKVTLDIAVESEVPIKILTIRQVMREIAKAVIN